MYQYSVESPYGRFNVTGTGALRKLVHELWAIRQLSEIRRSKAFAAAAVQSATKPLQFGKNVITQPVDTLSGVPRGVGRLLSNASTGATTEHDPSEDSRAKELLLVASWKRDYATRYDVDPYSSNPALSHRVRPSNRSGRMNG